MTGSQRVARRWLIGYVAGIFVTLPFALPCWNAFLRDSLGRVITIQQIHVAQYVGLGGVAACYAHAAARSRLALIRLAGLVVVVGLLDEGVQWLLPQRVFDWSDVLLNWLGGLGGLLLFGAMAWGLHRLRRQGAQHPT